MKTIILLATLYFVPVLNAAQSQSERQSLYCNTWLMGAHVVQGNRCRFSDEAMVGIESVDPMRIRCARISVRCNRNSVPEEEISFESNHVEATK